MHWDLYEFPSNPVLHPLFLVGRTWLPPPNSPDFRRWIVSIRIWGANVSVKLCWSLAWASGSIPNIKLHWEPPLERATFLEISPKNPNRGSWMMMMFRFASRFREWICWAGFWQHTHWSSSPISIVRTAESGEAAEFSVFKRPPFGLSFSLLFARFPCFFFPKDRPEIALQSLLVLFDILVFWN